MAVHRPCALEYIPCTLKKPLKGLGVQPAKIANRLIEIISFFFIICYFNSFSFLYNVKSHTETQPFFVSYSKYTKPIKKRAFAAKFTQVGEYLISNDNTIPKTNIIVAITIDTNNRMIFFFIILLLFYKFSAIYPFVFFFFVVTSYEYF